MPSNILELDQQSMEDDLKGKQKIANLVTGGIAGGLATTVTCPIEAVKTHLQASKGGSNVESSFRQEVQVIECIVDIVMQFPLLSVKKVRRVSFVGCLLRTEVSPKVLSNLSCTNAHQETND